MLASQFDQHEKRMLQYVLPRDSVAFSRYFFKNKEARKYIVNPHHKVMADVKRRVFDGEIKRLIINIPPGYSKTEEWVINFMAEGLAINPQALFMHLSYADDLALGMTVAVQFEQQSFSARLVTISPEILNNQVTGRVRFLDKMPVKLRQNQRLNTQIILEQKLDILQVKRGQFLESSGGRYAYLIN